MVKTFMCKPTIAIVRRISDCVGTMNSSKIGRNRRGQLLLDGVSWNNGLLTMKWKNLSDSNRPKNKSRDRISNSRFNLFRCADHKSLLRKIGTLRGRAAGDLGGLDR